MSDKQDAERKWRNLMNSIADSIENAPDKVILEEADPKDAERIRTATLRTIKRWREIAPGVLRRRRREANSN